LGRRLSSVSLGTHNGDVHPDVAKTLTVVALCKPVLGSISFDLYN
jgi:hypothetical protein